MGAADRDDKLPPEVVEAELKAAGILTLENLQEAMAAHRADKTKDARIAALELEAELRRRELEVQWPLGELTPPHVDEEVSRKFAERGVLIAEKVGGRWFGTVANMEIWLKKTGRWFRNAEDERRWRRRFS